MKQKLEKIKHYNSLAKNRDNWARRNKYYHQKIQSLVRFLIPENCHILDIGCATGDLLASLKPVKGVGIDFSEKMVAEAEKKYVDEDSFQFKVADIETLDMDDTFDYVLMSDVVGDLGDVWTAFRNIRKVTNKESRLVITFYNNLWEPVLNLATTFGLKMPQPKQNWLSSGDIINLLDLNGFDVIKQGHELLFPKQIPVISSIFNSFLVKLPLIKHLALSNYIVARKVSEPTVHPKEMSVTVLIPCRNERGNIRDAIERLPEFGSHIEILFVDGNSNDGTVEEIEKIIKEYKEKDIKLLHQIEPDSAMGENHGLMLSLGKGDAVRKGFDAAEGEVLMILDADLTVPPEELPRFYNALIEGRGEFINGTRLVYPMEKEAMRFLNVLGNKFFSFIFSWILGQRIKDTLCGTKVLTKENYQKIADNREFFGNFDPFGDFDLLFGAAKQNLKIIELPVHYKERTYGEIKIERFKHGLILLKMSVFAMFRLKFRS
ncbi:MAG: bifunctional class I SAM-dependent methyltransferase/glycosyltransferase family 2 protein [Pseudomonadota bacterium]